MLLIVPVLVLAQRTVHVQPGFGTLNRTIMGDTTSTGARVDANTVYVLQRGGEYILDGLLEHRFPLTMVASSGTGPRPRILLGVPSGGVAPEQTLRPRANLTIRGLYITALDELGGLQFRIIRMSENNIRVIVEDCHLDRASQAGFRFDGTNIKLYFYRSIISNIGTMASPDNGRGFDDRGNDIDTLIIENSTFYNLTSRVIRDGGGIIRYGKMNHNTMHNIGQFGTSFGQSREAYFTNNMVVNAAFLGNPPGFTREVVGVDTLATGGTLRIVIKNNNFYSDPAIAQAYADSVKPAPLFDATALAFIAKNGHAATNTTEAITFTKAPAHPRDAIISYYRNPAGTHPPLDTVQEASFRFDYPSTRASYTGSEMRQPIGALTWFNQAIIPTSVERLEGAIPERFELFANYPNPFNPETNIRYTLIERGSVSLAIFNMLGQKVATIVNEMQEPGSYSVRWNGRDDFGTTAPSGIYFYQLSVGGSTSTRSMVLLK
jgi:hypothetical protein